MLLFNVLFLGFVRIHICNIYAIYYMDYILYAQRRICSIYIPIKVFDNSFSVCGQANSFCVLVCKHTMLPLIA